MPQRRKKAPPAPPAKPKFKIYQKIAWSFVLLTLLLVAAIIYFSISKATIAITPEKEEVNKTLEVKIKAKSAESDNFVLAGKFKEVVLEKEKEFSPAQETELTSKVRGTVVVYNKWSKNQPLVKTTRLLAPAGLLFRITKSIDVPAGGQAEVEAEADKEGSEYEIGPTKFTIPGLWSGLQDKIYAESKTTMTAARQKVRIVTADDIQNARNTLKQELFAAAIEQLKKQNKNRLPSSLETKDLFPSFEFSEKATAAEIVEFSHNTEVGEETDSFKAKLKLKTIAIAFSETELLDLLKTELASAVPAYLDLYSIDQNKFTYQVKSYDLDKEEAVLEAKLAGLATIKKDDPRLAPEKFTALDSLQITSYLSKIKGVEKAEIKISPLWTRKTPAQKERIEIKFRY